jgi:hypothetical protein
LRKLIFKSNQNFPTKLRAARKLQLKYFLRTGFFSFLKSPFDVINRRGRNIFRRKEGYKP